MLYLATRETEYKDEIKDTLPKALCRDLKHYQQQRIIFTSPAFRMGIVGLFLLTPILCAWGITLFHNNMQQPKTHSSNQTIIDDNLSLKEQASYFEQALIDYIAALNSAFDGYYGYETPTEKGYSDE